MSSLLPGSYSISQSSHCGPVDSGFGESHRKWNDGEDYLGDSGLTNKSREAGQKQKQARGFQAAETGW